MPPPLFPNSHPHAPITSSPEDGINDGNVPSAREDLSLIHQGLPRSLVPTLDDDRLGSQVGREDIPMLHLQLWGAGVNLTVSLQRRVRKESPPSQLDHRCLANLATTTPSPLHPYQGSMDT